jgi:hypothetical protein
MAGDVSVFPILTLDRSWSPHVEPVRSAVEAAGYRVAIVTSPFEFERAEGHAGRQIMRVRRA